MSLFEIKNLNVFAKDSGKQIVKNANIKVNAGEIVVVIGGNGAGKSTIFSSILDKNAKESLVVTADQIIFDDKLINPNYDDENAEYLRQNIAYIKQEEQLKEHFVISSIKNEAILSQATKTDINKKINELFKYFGQEELKYRSTKSLSGGQNKLINIFKGLTRKSKLIILDEPLNNLDGKNAILLNNYLIKLAKQNEMGIIIITHCRMFSKVNRAYEVFKGEVSEQNYQCKNCYGELDENKEFYKVK